MVQATQTTTSAEPLRDANGKVLQEIWSKYNLLFNKEGYDLHLQPGQYLPLWQIHDNGLAYENCCVTTFTAMVIAGRALIKGGDSKLSSHPTLEAWDNPQETGMTGAVSQLRHPGGLRKLAVGPTPTLVTSSRKHFSEMALTAPKFRDVTRNSTLMDGAALEIVTPDSPKFDATQYSIFNAYNVMTEKVETFRRLPLPIVLSDEEDVVLAGYPATWKKALETFYELFNIRESGVLYRGVANDNLTFDTPSLVWRKPAIKGDLGFSTLDPDIYNRMLPFDGAKLVEEYL